MTKKDRGYRQGIIDKELANAVLPVDPDDFTKKVQVFLTSVGVLVSDDVHQVIGKLCRLLNYSIVNPKLGGLLNRKNILIYPAETGIGKSVSLQHYAAMLKDESSLIVVNTVEEAREYCNSINALRTNKEYAKFVASKKTSDGNQLDILKHNPQDVQCLVLTNKMFTTLHINPKDPIEVYQLYRNNLRDLVVIDERIPLMTKTMLNFEELEGIYNFLQSAYFHSPSMKNNKDVKAQLDSVGVIIDAINEAQCDTASLVERLTLEDKLESAGLPMLIDFKGLYDLVATRLDELNSEVSLLKPSKIANLGDIKNTVRQTINSFIKIAQPKSPVEGVTHSVGDEIYSEFATYKKNLYRVSSVFNQFGTAVVLDATAEVNAFYLHSSNLNSNLDVVSAPRVRKYENLTIYKAKNQPQSANAIYKRDKDTAKDNAKWYASVINEILEVDDKLLIISFKDFIDDHLKQYFESEGRVQFTNWGKHVGRNNWSDCNKVILIGWLRMAESEIIAKLFHAASLGSKDIATMKYVSPENVKVLQHSEIADDLVQGAMRCRARVIDTADSDCKTASVYLFEDVLEGSKTVIELFESQFPSHKLVNWTPKASRPLGTLYVPNQKKEKAINYLQTLAQSNRSYARSAFCKEFGVAPSTFSRWLVDGYFKTRLEELGYRIVKPDGKPERIIFE